MRNNEIIKFLEYSVLAYGFVHLINRLLEFMIPNYDSLLQSNLLWYLIPTVVAFIYIFNNHILNMKINEQKNKYDEKAKECKKLKENANHFLIHGLVKEQINTDKVNNISRLIDYYRRYRRFNKKIIIEKYDINKSSINLIINIGSNYNVYDEDIFFLYQSNNNKYVGKFQIIHAQNRLSQGIIIDELDNKKYISESIRGDNILIRPMFYDESYSTLINEIRKIT